MNVLSAVGTVRDGELTIISNLPDVAVIDNRLPDGSGIELCRILTRTTPQVALVLYTGTVTSNIVLEALQAGATAVLPKTIRTDNLLEAIRSTRYTALS